jgi:hypothetical protein
VKSFKDFLMEMPQINTYHNKDRMSEYAEDVRNRIHNSSEKEEKLEDNIYRKNIENNHVYYNKDESGYPKELSIISKGNTHLFTHRGCYIMLKNMVLFNLILQTQKVQRNFGLR